MVARAVAAVLVLAAALAVSSVDATLRRHRVAGGAESMSSEEGVLVNSNAAAPKDARDGYGISAGMGDWLSTPSHHRKAQHHAVAPAPAATQRFAQQQHKPSGADALLPLVSAPGNAYSTPRASNTEPELNAQNTPIARDLPSQPTPLMSAGGEGAAQGAVEGAEVHAPQHAQPMPPPPSKRLAKAAGAAAAHRKPQPQHRAHHQSAAAGTVESAGAYEMPTQFAGTTVSRDTNSERDPDAFFHMTAADTHASQAGAAAEHSAAMGKPLYATGEGAAQFDTIDKWQTELASKAKVNALHKQLLAKAHGKPLPPPKPHKPSARFLQRLAKQKKAQAKARAKAEAQAKAQAEAQAQAEAAAKAAAEAEAAKAAPAPASELDADAQEFVSFARALGEDIDPVKHRGRIARAAQLVLEDRLSRDARFQQLKAAEERARKAKAERKRAAKRAAQRKQERERAQLARELARVKREREALAAEKKRVAQERRKLAAVAKLKANALKSARAKLKAQKLKAERAEREHASAIPSHLLAGAVPLPPAAPAAAPAAPKPTAAAVAANPFLQYATAPAAPAAPPAPAAAVAPAAAPAPVAAAKPVVPAAAAPAPAVRPAAPPAPAPAAKAPVAAAKPALSAEELAMANYVGDKPVIFAASNDEAVVRNPLPPPSGAAAPRVEYIAPTPLSQLPTAEYIPHAAADNREASKLVIAADADAHSGSNAAAEDTGTTTYGSADDLLQGGEALLQTGSTAKATAHASAGKWPHASKGASGDDKTGGSAPKLNPVLSCILANCSVPYLSCLSSMSCSAVFDCLQSTNAPIVHCARFHARMGEKDKRLFAELSDCEQREQCFGPQQDGGDQPQSEPVTSASTNGAVLPPAAASPAPATPSPEAAKLAAPVAAEKPASPAAPRPQSCEVLCTRKCAGVADGADKCVRSCNAACFKKRYVVGA